LQLCEAESVSYLDEVATSPNSMQLGQTLALEVSSHVAQEYITLYLLLLKFMFSFSKFLFCMIAAGS